MEDQQIQNSQQNTTTETSSPSKKKQFIVIFGGILILLLATIGAYTLGQRSEKAKYEYAVIYPSPTKQPTVSPVTLNGKKQTLTIKDEKSLDNTWVWKIIDLYNLELQLPPIWTLREVNRRPEPTREFDPKTGHDCAEYLITDNKYVNLSLKPTCGFADGGADSWPSGSIIVKDLGNGRFIIRYFDSSKSAYVYAHASRSQNGELQSGILSLGDNSNFVIIHTELKYNGPESEKEQYLKDADTIISSLKKL